MDVLLIGGEADGRRIWVDGMPSPTFRIQKEYRRRWAGSPGDPGEVVSPGFDDYTLEVLTGTDDTKFYVYMNTNVHVKGGVIGRLVLGYRPAT